jgi:hypothetical protein
MASTASSLGVSQQVVQTGMSTAQSMMNQTPNPTQADKDKAAQAGVTAAGNQAQSEGKPMTVSQEQGLLNFLKSVL